MTLRWGTRPVRVAPKAESGLSPDERDLHQHQRMGADLELISEELVGSVKGGDCDGWGAVSD